MCNASKHSHNLLYLFITSFFKAGQKILSREPSLLSQRFPARPLLSRDSHRQLAQTSLVGGKRILRHTQVAITTNKFSLARPKGNPGYLSNSVPPSTAFLFNGQHQVFTQEAWKFFSSRTKISHRETTQVLASNTLKDILVNTRCPKITIVRG